MLCCLEVIRPGSWQRAFHSAHDRSRFRAPRVVKTDWPNVAVTQARNVKDRLLVSLRNLKLTSEKTSIDIENLSDDFVGPVRVNNVNWTNWERLSSGQVRVYLRLPRSSSSSSVDVEMLCTGWCGDNSDDDWKPISIRDFPQESKI